VAEGLEHKIQLVAEGVANVNEKLDRHIEESEGAHQEILSAIKFSYAELDRRITTLEEDFLALKSRVERLPAGRQGLRPGNVKILNSKLNIVGLIQLAFFLKYLERSNEGSRLKKEDSFWEDKAYVRRCKD